MTVQASNWSENMAKVDVLVPCYNYARFLESCVRSVLDQSVRDLRVLIIDDASSDDSISVSRKLAEMDPRVTFISHSENWGHINTYNQGIEWASADYFLLLSADDLLAPGALMRAIEVMEANSDIVLTHGKSIDWRDDTPIPTIIAAQNYGWTRQDLIREMCLAGSNLINTPTAIGRTRIQKLVGGYRPDLPHSGDMEMWLRFAAHGGVARIDAVQAIYRRHSSNMSNQYYEEDWSDYPLRKAAFHSFFREYADFPESPSLRLLADHTLAEHAFWSGISRLRRGRIHSGLNLLRFSMDLNPRLRFGPTLSSILRKAAEKLFGRM
jgi:glycosyltransferase involved in cell wall biosynthesis